MFPLQPPPRSSTWVVIFLKGVWPWVLPCRLSAGGGTRFLFTKPWEAPTLEVSAEKEELMLGGNGWPGEDGRLTGGSCHSEEEGQSGKEPTRSGIRRSWTSFGSLFRKEDEEDARKGSLTGRLLRPRLSPLSSRPLIYWFPRCRDCQCYNFLESNLVTCIQYGVMKGFF